MSITEPEFLSTENVVPSGISTDIGGFGLTSPVVGSIVSGTFCVNVGFLETTVLPDAPTSSVYEGLKSGAIVLTTKES